MECDPARPPGTVKLQELFGDDDDDSAKDARVILQPRPTDNPNDPLNWPKYQKVINFTLASFYAMMVYAFINATSPTWGPMGDELNFSSATLTNTYAIGCATLAMGAPMLIPFALKYGSRPVYVLSSIFQFVISIWAARTRSAGDWWGVNALQCWFGALAEVLIQMTIADVFFVHERGLMNSIYVWVANVGSNLAVVAAGFITIDQGWRWVWWWCTIFFACQVVLFAFGFEETKFTVRDHEVIEGQQAVVGAHSDRSQGTLKAWDANPNTDMPSEKAPAAKGSPNESTDQAHLNDGGHSREFQRSSLVKKPRKTYWRRLSLFTVTPGPWSHFLRHAWQPFMILASIPGVLFCSLTYAVLLAWSTVMTAALSTIMLQPPYNFSASQIGLMSLAPFVGSTIGSCVVGPISDWVVLRLSRRNKGIYEPEFRFYVFLPFIPFQLAGAWWFGYGLARGSPWPEIAVAYGLSFVGSAPLQSLALTYMLDAYNEIIGDALTGLTFVRNLFSTIFVFAMSPWIAAVGVPNVFNTIGAIGALILSFAGFFIWKGKHLRHKTAGVYRHYARRQFYARSLE